MVNNNDAPLAAGCWAVLVAEGDQVPPGSFGEHYIIWQKERSRIINTFSLNTQSILPNAPRCSNQVARLDHATVTRAEVEYARCGLRLGVCDAHRTVMSRVIDACEEGVGCGDSLTQNENHPPSLPTNPEHPAGCGVGIGAAVNLHVFL